MACEPMETRLSREWGLDSAQKIKAKILADCKETDKLTQLLDAKKLVVCGYALGKHLASYKVGLKSAQLRRFYESFITLKTLLNRVKSEAKGEEAFHSRIFPQILMLKPQLANAQARQKREVTPFFEVINPLFDLIQDGDDYERLCDFVEAIVAYHKYCGGRD